MFARGTRSSGCACQLDPLVGYSTYEFWSISSNNFRMKRALSAYERIVDMPTRASEKDTKMGERVVLCVDQPFVH